MAVSSVETFAPASSRIASPKLRPFSIAARSTWSKRSIMLRRCSRLTSIQCPRTSARPSEWANSALISADVSFSPSSVTSIWKSRSALWPSPEGALPPTVPVTRGRGGRLPLHAAGMRTTTPAASSCGTSRKTCRASAGVHRSGWKISPASTMAFSHGHVSEARCTGTSRDKRRCLFAAPAYSLRACPSGRCCALVCPDELVDRRVV